MNPEVLLDTLTNLVPRHPWAQLALNLGLLALAAVLAQWVVTRTILYLAHRLLDLSGHGAWNVALLRHRAYHRLWFATPFAVVALGIGEVPHLDHSAHLIERVAHAGAWICVFMALHSLLSAWQDVYSGSTRAQTRSIKGYIQMGKLALALICGVLVLSILLDRSPLWMLSGLGALSAVLLLVFKDTLLSLVASTQLTSNDMLRIGDWIEMPQSNADGFVQDIALHTVKVRNWDNTVTTVPTYKLFSESYRNYRQMFESGARRIKRTLRIDASGVRFLRDDEIAGLMRLRLLHDYLEEKQAEVERTNRELGASADEPVNRRRLTNLGTFRAYAMAYLRQHAEIRHDLLLNVRMMEPGSEGVPVEVYCFTAVTAWMEYERIQGDIFDHLLAILPEMGLRLYQAPSGADLGGMRSQWLADAAAAQRASPRPSPSPASPAFPEPAGRPPL